MDFKSLTARLNSAVSVSSDAWIGTRCCNPSAALLLAHARRSRMPRYLEALAGIRDLSAVDLQNREILGQIISDQNVVAVGSEHRSLGQSADLDILGLGHLLSVDLQHRNAAIRLMVEGLLHVGAAQDGGDREIAPRRHRQSFRTVADHHPI